MENSDMLAKSFYESLAEIQKFNPYHNAKGQFSSGNAATSFTYAPGKSPAHDAAIAREKTRDTDGQLTFHPAKTIKEAETFAHDRLGVQTVRFGKCSVETANQVNQSLAEHFRDFPELKQRIQFIGSEQERNRLVENRGKETTREFILKDLKRRYPDLDDQTINYELEKYMKMIEDSGHFKVKRVPGNVYALSHSGDWSKKMGLQGISINEKYGKNAETMARSLQGDVESKFHPPHTGTIKGVIDHELGHQLDHMLGMEFKTNIANTFIAKNQEEMMHSLSKYANKNIAEFIAEGWSEYKNSPNPRPTAQMIGTEIREGYARWKQK